MLNEHYPAEYGANTTARKIKISTSETACNWLITSRSTGGAVKRFNHKLLLLAAAAGAYISTNSKQTSTTNKSPTTGDSRGGRGGGFGQLEHPARWTLGVTTLQPATCS